MTDAFLASPDSFELITFSSELDRQDQAVRAIGNVLVNDELSSDERDEAIMEIGMVYGCTTLERRMLHMFALEAVMRARAKAEE